MKLPPRLSYSFLSVLLVIALLIVPACSSRDSDETQLKEIKSAPLSITLLHVGDTNSYVIPHDVMFKFNDRNTLTTAGGWSLLMAAVEDIRNREQNVMLLHAGGVIEGTLWTTKFGGLADMDAMNTLQFNALTPGDNDFSGGPAEASALFKKALFPVLAANIDISREPAFTGLFKPYTVVECGGQLIGVIGLVTPDIMLQSKAGKNIIVLPPVPIARKYVAELNQQGINKIIVLSHLGYPKDLELAGRVNGVDVIVGAHSGTFMGGDEFKQIGLNPSIPYPTEVKDPAGDKVLIVHAWENNQLLGKLNLTFDERGRVTGYNGQPFIPAMPSFQINEEIYGWVHLCSCRPEFNTTMELLAQNQAIKMYWNNGEMDRTLQPYVSEISGELNNIVAIAEEDICRGPNTGPGPIIADAILWSAHKANPDVQIAIYRSDRVRSDIYKGSIIINNVHMLVPYRQTITIMKIYGNVLKSALEKGLDTAIVAGQKPPVFEIAGFKMSVDMSRKAGERITSLQLRNADGSYMDMNRDGLYTLAADDSLAGYIITSTVQDFGWLGPLANNLYDWLKGYFQYNNTIIKDTDAVADYLRVQKNIRNTTDERTTILPAVVK